MILLSIIFLGCQPILRGITGIKKPQVESYKSIDEYISDNNLPIDSDKSLFLSKKADYKNLSNLRGEMFRLPDIYLFNSKGQFIEENNFCMALKTELKNNPNENYYKEIFRVDSLISHEKTIKDLESILIKSNGAKVNLNQDNNIAVILWAKFLNRKNKKHIINAKEQLENSDNSVSIYYLNIDELETWKE